MPPQARRISQARMLTTTTGIQLSQTKFSMLSTQWKKNLCRGLILYLELFKGYMANWIIERAHQIGRVNETGDRSSMRPRVVVMKFMNYADKWRVLKAAKNAGHLSCYNQRILFFPDILTDLLKRRKVFDPVKKQLAAFSCPDLHYGIVHPAKLLITIRGRRHIR